MDLQLIEWLPNFLYSHQQCRSIYLCISVKVQPWVPLISSRAQYGVTHEEFSLMALNYLFVRTKQTMVESNSSESTWATFSPKQTSPSQPLPREFVLKCPKKKYSCLAQHQFSCVCVYHFQINVYFFQALNLQKNKFSDQSLNSLRELIHVPKCLKCILPEQDNSPIWLSVFLVRDFYLTKFSQYSLF